MINSAPAFFSVRVTVPDFTAAPSPCWLSAQQLAESPSAGLGDWLFDQGSLTRRLTCLAAGEFAVQPLVEGWQALRADECQALDVPPDSPGWVREVLLQGKGQAWVFARSVAARTALESSGFDLQHLGNRSLGELLFSDRAFQRGELQASPYPAAWLPPALRAADLWARRSCFRRDALTLLVTEVFLPALWQQPGALSV